MTKQYFTPYFEVKNNRQDIAVTSGSDTSLTDGFRQGIEVTNDKFRYTGAIPILGTGDSNNEIDVTSFGQPKEFNDFTKFQEILKFDAAVYLRSSLAWDVTGGAAMFPDVQESVSYDDINSYDGFIEPLTIESREVIASTQRASHLILGHMQDGNENALGKTSCVFQTYKFKEITQVNDLYIDAGDTMGSSGSISLPGIFDESEKQYAKFDESRYLMQSLPSGSLISGVSNDLLNAMIRLSGSITDQYISVDLKSAGAGFTYDLNSIGTDSLAFGGLLRRDPRRS